MVNTLPDSQAQEHAEQLKDDFLSPFLMSCDRQ